MKKKHNEIPLKILMIPGVLLLTALLLLTFQATDWAFLFVGIAIVIAILIHKENE
jgi:hypothetical protein